MERKECECDIDRAQIVPFAPLSRTLYLSDTEVRHNTNALRVDGKDTFLSLKAFLL